MWNRHAPILRGRNTLSLDVDTVLTDTSYALVNQITLIDSQGRMRAEYARSQTPPKLIVNDLQKIQS